MRAPQGSRFRKLRDVSSPSLTSTGGFAQPAKQTSTKAAASRLLCCDICGLSFSDSPFMLGRGRGFAVSATAFFLRGSNSHAKAAVAEPREVQQYTHREREHQRN